MIDRCAVLEPTSTTPSRIAAVPTPVTSPATGGTGCTPVLAPVDSREPSAARSFGESRLWTWSLKEMAVGQRTEMVSELSAVGSPESASPSELRVVDRIQRAEFAVEWQLEDDSAPVESSGDRGTTPFSERQGRVAARPWRPEDNYPPPRRR